MTTTNDVPDPLELEKWDDAASFPIAWKWDEDEALLNPGWNPANEFLVLLRSSHHTEFYFPVPRISAMTLPLLKAFLAVLGEWIAQEEEKEKHKAADSHQVNHVVHSLAVNFAGSVKLLVLVNPRYHPPGTLPSQNLMPQPAVALPWATAIGSPDPTVFYAEFDPQVFDVLLLQELIPLPGMDSPILAQQLALLRNSLHPLESDGYILLFYGFGLVQGDPPTAEIALGYWDFLPESDDDGLRDAA